MRIYCFGINLIFTSVIIFAGMVPDAPGKAIKKHTRKKVCIKVKESFEKDASEDIGRLGIAQDILRKSTDFFRRIIALVSGVGGVTLSYVCPRCPCFPLEDYIWWVSLGPGDGNSRKKKQCN